MKKILLFVLVLILFSCQKSNQKPKIEGLNWLIGKWINKSDQGQLVEIWNKKNDSIFLGESYFIKEKDTLHYEKIELLQKAEKLVFVSTIKGQNFDKPIVFIRNEETEGKWIFENPKIDFPKKIQFLAFSTNRLLIEMSSFHNNKPYTVKYSLIKVKQ